MLLSKKYILLVKLKFASSLPTKSFTRAGCSNLFQSPEFISAWHVGIWCLMSQEVVINSCSTSDCIGLKGVAKFLSNTYDFWWYNKKQTSRKCFWYAWHKNPCSNSIWGTQWRRWARKPQESHLMAPISRGCFSQNTDSCDTPTFIPHQTECCCYSEKLRHKGKASTSKVCPKFFIPWARGHLEAALLYKTWAMTSPLNLNDRR